MKIYSFVVILLGGVMTLGCQNKKATVAEAVKKPNVILIMADDLGWGDTGFNGNKIIKTPHLDEMAREGVQFNRFYSASAVCSPTRASVLTGRNPMRTGVFNANDGILRSEEVTLPELLKEEGYATGHFGKWHLGTLTHTEKDANRGKQGNTKEYNPPKLHGYDDAFVTESKVPTWDPMKKPIRKNLTKKGWDYLKPGEPFKAYGTYYWDIDGNKITKNLDGDDSQVMMDRVLPFIDKSVEQKQPFLAVVWFHTPHMPCVAGPEYQKMYAGQDPLMQNYAGSITAMDDQIGRLRKHLKTLGVDENTMIWFCSDNGPENGNSGVTGGFKERKRSLHEGGVRVPGLLVWPNKIKKPFKTDFPAVTSDYLPTIATVLDIDASKLPYVLDGIDLIPVLEGSQKKREKPIGFSYLNQISYTTNEMKVYVRGEKLEYYNIANDPFEEFPLQKDNKFKVIKGDMDKFLQSCKKSFEGKEYGTVSFDKLGQSWVNPYMFNLKKEKK
ncbi:sulfatase-like hydrolase/transferase [Tamlana sp. 2201CG12-4]|uniref:sulfatase family protein n=1 Tax=Tamlana sp. 2201CG12-4 TaxID=3112582 RepID=UPI002DB8042B|nr:sulfatase-like hydrolase/transferase [Tamlana sp. 2201CG12-4]MEC3908795.1 sulfatase-like hydrolase/transferase [Tamlana sp. 2201CG12-4]